MSEVSGEGGERSTEVDARERMYGGGRKGAETMIKLQTTGYCQSKKHYPQKEERRWWILEMLKLSGHLPITNTFLPFEIHGSFHFSLLK